MRSNFEKEVEFIKIVFIFGVIFLIIGFGEFEGFFYFIREFVEGEFIFFVDVEKEYFFRIVEKIVFLDWLGIDYG